MYNGSGGGGASFSGSSGNFQPSFDQVATNTQVDLEVQNLFAQYGPDLGLASINMQLAALVGESEDIDNIRNFTDTSTLQSNVQSTLNFISTAITLTAPQQTWLVAALTKTADNADNYLIAADVNALLTSIYTELSTLNGDITSINSTIATIQSDQITDESNIASIYTELTTLTGDITSINSTIATIQSNQTTDESNITTIQGQITTIEAEIAGMGPGGVQALIQDNNSTPNVTLTTTATTLQLALPSSANMVVSVDATDNILNLTSNQNLIQLVTGSSTAANSFYAGDQEFGNNTLQVNTNQVLFQGSGASEIMDAGSGNIRRFATGATTGFDFINGTYPSGAVDLFTLNQASLQAQNGQKALGFANSSSSAITNDEVLTWGFMKTFIDHIFPIGILMMSTNGSPPTTFGGYITWTLYSAANSKYLKMTTIGATVATSQSSSLLAHDHTFTAGGQTFTGAGVTFTGSTPTFTGNALTFTGAVPTFTGSSVTTSIESAESTFHFNYGTNYSNVAGTTQAVANFSSGTTYTLNGDHTHTVTAAGTVSACSGTINTPTGTISTVTGTVTTPTGTVSTASGTTDSTGAGASNEVDAIYVLIYVRSA